MHEPAQPGVQAATSLSANAWTTAGEVIVSETEDAHAVIYYLSR